jgi:Fur family zinc uptake transcriptional regulator
MAQFLICSRCNQVGELDDPEIEVIIKKKASAAGFSVVRPTVEVMGICANCAADSHAG